MVQQPQTGGSAGGSTTTQDPAVRSVDLVKVYGEGPTAVRALDGVSLTVPSGLFLAVMGPSGSGKSTLLHCLAGLDRPTSGRVVVGGTDLADLNDRKLTRLRRDDIGFIFQQYNLVPTLTARENITLPFDLAGTSPDSDWFDSVVGTLGIADRLGHRPAELSGGQQQRVAAARALITRPAVVFADEPTGALDSTSGAELLDFLRRVVHDFDQTVVMVTHDPLAASYAELVTFLADGRVVAELDDPSPEAVLDHIKKLEAI